MLENVDFNLTVRGAALGTVPTITEIGMAALLPRAGHSAKVVAVGSGKLGLQIDRTVIKDRKDRVAFLKEHAGVPVFDAKLDDLLPKPTKRVKDGIPSAQLILITSQEIDELGEAENMSHARRQMDGVLNDLRRGFRILVDLGVKAIVLTADHGHLFGEEIGEDMKIEAPGGETADLHRRVWLGAGGNSQPSYLRTSMQSLGIESDLDIATPWTLACFKSKGGTRAYFHGGLSPQELIIPVVVMTPTAQGLSGPPTGIQWALTAGSKKLSTRFFSVQVSGQTTGLFGIEGAQGASRNPGQDEVRLYTGQRLLWLRTSHRRFATPCVRDRRKADRAGYCDADGGCGSNRTKDGEHQPTRCDQRGRTR